MDLLQPITKYIIDPILAGWEHSSYPAYLEELEKSQYFPTDQFEQLRFVQLRKILLHAYRNCPFYTNRFNEAGFDPAKIQTPDELSQLPVLAKKDIQEHSETLKAKNFPNDQLIKNQTGGSTGAPLVFYADIERLDSRKAATYRHDRWAGWDIGVKTAVLWGHHRDFLGDQNWKAKFREQYFERKMFLDTSEITPEILAGFTSKLLDFQPSIFLAYANAVYLYARYLKENKIGTYHCPEAIITSAELLTPEQRQVIEQTFNCRVYNRYGCRETSIIASECSTHQGMHICAETLYPEFIRGNRPAKPGEPGKIVITDLLNYGMPLIRYQIEDMGSPVIGECSCGRSLPRMEITGGRVTDFIVTPEGKVVSGAAMTIYFVATVTGIAQAQLVQKRKDFIVLRIVKDVHFTNETEMVIKQKVVDFFGSSMNYELEFTDTIAQTASGKYRFSISEIDPMEFLQ